MGGDGVYVELDGRPTREGHTNVWTAKEILMRWTNGPYKSTVHQVMSRPGMPAKYNVPFFSSINYDTEVEALPERTVGASLFRSMKAGEYVLGRRKRRTRLGRALMMLGL